jgi:hypothetical protein
MCRERYYDCKINIFFKGSEQKRQRPNIMMMMIMTTTTTRRHVYSRFVSAFWCSTMCECCSEVLNPSVVVKYILSASVVVKWFVRVF